MTKTKEKLSKGVEETTGKTSEENIIDWSILNESLNSYEVFEHEEDYISPEELSEEAQEKIRNRAKHRRIGRLVLSLEDL